MVSRNAKSGIHSQGILGFTLIELLVVVSIISMLVSILLPALGQARKQAQKTICLVNLKQISMGLEIYATECNDALALIYQRHWGNPRIDGLAGDGRGYYWGGLLKEQCELEMELFKCPSDKRKMKLNEEFFWVPDWNGGETTAWFDAHPVSYCAPLLGYGLAGRQIPWSVPGLAPVKRSRIPNPNTMHVVWDGETHVESQSTGFVPYFNIIQAELAAGHVDLMFRHAKPEGADLTVPGFGPNALLADGHVEPTICLAELSEDNFNFPK